MHQFNATISQLRHFIALADRGSFTRAADSARRSQAAFSRSISMLEAALGVSLVSRHGRSNSLTPIGQLVLAHARQVVAQADTLQQLIQEHLSADAGMVRVGLTPAAAAIAGKRLLHMAVLHPKNFRMQISRGQLSQQVEALRSQELDALVTDPRLFSKEDNDLEIRSLAILPTAALASRDHPLAALEHVSIDDLLMYPIACTDITSEYSKVLIQHFGPNTVPDLHTRISSDVLDDLFDVVMQSSSIYTGIIAPASKYLADGRLIRLPISFKGLEAQLGWVQLRTRPSPVMLDDLFSQIKTLLEADGPDNYQDAKSEN